MSPIDLVREFWRLMATNDFYSVAAVVSPDFTVEWPQSKERIRGVSNFGALNTEYPSNGPWVFTIHRVVGGTDEAVSDVAFTDSVQHARVISFFSVSDNRISRIVEYWPEPYPPPSNRTHLVERLD